MQLPQAALQAARMPITAFRAGVHYLSRNPTEVIYAARNAAGFRVVLPLDALRWAAKNLPQGRHAPTDISIGSKPPALTVAATLDLMGNGLRAGAAIRIDELRIGPDEFRIVLRLSDVTMQALGSQGGPLAALLQSGALDLSKPGNLVNFLPKRPVALVEAQGDRIALDLMKLPKLAKSALLKRILAIVTPVFVIREIVTTEDHLLLSWRPRVRGLTESVAAFRTTLK